MRSCEIVGWGSVLPERVVRFGDAVRYRIDDDTTQRDMLASAAARALAHAGMTTDDIDLVLGASAAGIQPIPCTAALVWERLTLSGHAAAFDVNSTCTSFITALDVASRYLRDGDHSTVLVVAGDVGSRFLNPAQQESFELFSDAAVAVVVTRSAEPGRGVLASRQQTWPAHAHDTEIRGGLSRSPAQDYATADPADYLFDMDGRRALLGMMRVLPDFFARFLGEAALSHDDIALWIPHQASAALGPMLDRIGVPADKRVDEVASFGNMVSASVPFMLVRALEAGRIGRGDLVVLCGTAAGLTANALALRL
ncbi:3-oxoacyl-[acyl-carrier-protein] synthase III C-terminal domain-containing protein [uncultured Microbacterium sp.]|uniref:3-oxoacyl-[acyl-carrier-protein] synthase III C-terminal domain-containing protein n=1 Tax=uncultured Microbacterium sp. TaxID=191216 RepID=UPI0025D75E97|nr:3-oxoacyl-[acyl-carrier-protein] synthase III C-terminal domain-containing protein [uncultured Microbacterium sp.]